MPGRPRSPQERRDTQPRYRVSIDIFDANPRVKRVVFICVPHRGSPLARGKGDTPNSSDGVVEYRSSRLDSAQSELIVPGPHGSYQLTETVSELQRILRLHLITSDQ